MIRMGPTLGGSGRKVSASHYWLLGFLRPGSILQCSQKQQHSLPRCCRWVWSRATERKEGLSKTRARARSLLNLDRYPVGCFGPLHYGESRDILDRLKKFRATDGDTVTTAFDVFERVILELEHKIDHDQIHWVCRRYYLHPLYRCWKTAALNYQAVHSPQELVLRVESWNRKFPRFTMDRTLIENVMSVVMARADALEAPFVGEDLLRYAINEANLTKAPDLRPDVVCYNMVLDAWEKSKLPQSNEMMLQMLTYMREAGVKPNNDSFNIVLRRKRAQQAEQRKLEPKKINWKYWKPPRTPYNPFGF